MLDDFLPIAMCVILPIAIVLIVCLTRVYSIKKRTQIIIKAIEANKDIDADKLVESYGKPEPTPLSVLNARLLRGCLYSLVGLVLIIVGIVCLATGSEFGNDDVYIPMLFGGISLAVGASYLIVYVTTRNQVNK